MTQAGQWPFTHKLASGRSRCAEADVFSRFVALPGRHAFSAKGFRVFGLRQGCPDLHKRGATDLARWMLTRAADSIQTAT